MNSMATYAKILILKLSLPGIPGTQVKDKARTEKVTTEAGTTGKHGKVTKTLFADSERAAAIKKLAQNIRSFVAQTTLPGDGDGVYLVPLSVYAAVREFLDKNVATYRDLISDFAANLASEIEADRAGKNHLFAADDYPKMADLQKLRYTCSFEPMASGDRFADIFDGEAIAAELSAQFEQVQREFLENAEAENMARLLRIVGEQTAKLYDYHAAPKGKRLFTESTWDALADAAKTAETLNFLKNPEITRIAGEVQGALSRLVSHERMRDAINRQALIDDLRKAIAPRNADNGADDSGESEQPPTPEFSENDGEQVAEMETLEI